VSTFISGAVCDGFSGVLGGAFISITAPGLLAELGVAGAAAAEGVKVT